jgi:hypothetical protein
MGGSKLIKSPEHMQELFEAYSKETKENPRTKIEFVGKEGREEHVPLPTPLTMAGFEVYVMKSDRTEALGVDQYFVNQADLYDDYVGICRAIRMEIRSDQLTGGLIGQYNSSITQRLNGLTEKTEVKTDQPTEMVITVVKGKK